MRTRREDRFDYVDRPYGFFDDDGDDGIDDEYRAQRDDENRRRFILDEVERRAYHRGWEDARRYYSERPLYPIGNVHDQRRAYDREREHFERHQDDRYRFGDRDHMFERDDGGYHRQRRSDPFERDDMRRAISRFRDRDRRR